MLRNKSLVLLLALVLVVSFVVAGCGSKKTEQAAPTAPAKEPMTITYNLGTEPETLDPIMHTGKPESTVLGALLEGLTRYDVNHEIKKGSGMAEDWTISPDGLKYVFKLRKNAKWTNGEPVTAHDFEYAWKKLLAKDTASEYAYQLFYLKNGEKYNAGEAKAEEVGVKAVDDYTLEVELEAPTPYFIGLTAFTSLYPVNKKVDQANPDWHTKAETFVGNGPFKLVAWEHQQKLEMVKNPDYWDAATVKLDKVIMTMVESYDTELTMFQNNELDIGENPPLQEVKRLIADGTATVLPDPSTYYYIFNTQKKPFDDVRVRKAFTYAIDRKSIVENVTQAGQKPALAFVPFGFPDATPGADYREVGGDYFKDNDVETAKQLLADAGYPNGKGLPEIEILYNTSEGHKKIAEAIAQMWTTNLGAKVKLTNQEWGVYLDSRDQGNFMVARAGWGPDYADAMTFMDMHVTGGGNNDSFWGNKEYDRLIKIAKENADPAVRIKAMHDAEKIMMDELPVIPIYFYVNVNLYKPSVKNVAVPPFGAYQEFKWAYVQK
ncbi:ABC transporter substrate-binding protein [Clostridiales bacterium PH28_bin88]|nr:ABC transporter substrate-binding protein [Clostridiales bacterium PH28_bin88]